jgi:chromosomal replication initiator protein
MDFKEFQNLTREIIFRTYLATPISKHEIGWWKEGITAETFDRAQQLLASMEKHKELETAADVIIDTVCKSYKKTAEEIKERTRDQEIVEPRQIIMYLLTRNTRLSLNTIGSMLGGFDYATVLYSKRRVRELQTTNKAYAIKLRKITESINAK